MSGLVLRDYQAECVAAIKAAAARGVDRQLAVLPTGGGKTIIFGTVAAEVVVAPETVPQIVATVEAGGQVLILAHRDELLTQARDKLVAIAPELEMSIGFVKAGRNDVHSPVVIASVQTLARQSRLEQLPRDFALTIVDEGHHAIADSYQRVMDHVTGLILAVTATPERADGKSLEDLGFEIVFARSIEWMVDQGYLCPPRGKKISVEVDLSAVKKSHGDFQSEALADALEDAGALSDVLASYMEHGEGRKSLVFCPTVAMAHHCAEVFRTAGFAAEAIDGTTPAEERAAILRRLHTGETQILANVGVLTEGFDEPSVSCIIIAAPTKSSVKYTQIVGRGLRLYPGKSDCLILDVVGASEENSIASLPALFGLKSLLDGEDVITARQREDREAAEAEREEEGAGEQERQQAVNARDERRRRNAESIEFFSRERMNWTVIADKWTIPLSTEQTVVLWPQVDGEHFDVLLVKGDAKSFRFLARGLDFGYATGAAEETIRKHGNRILADSKAAWREDEVTKGQRGYLYKLGLGGEKPANKGEAADLITQATVVKTLERVEAAMLERELDRQLDADLERVA